MKILKYNFNILVFYLIMVLKCAKLHSDSAKWHQRFTFIKKQNNVKPAWSLTSTEV